MSRQKIDRDSWIALSRAAWDSRKNAFLMGKVSVGSAVLTTEGKIYSGCNIEHRFRCHDIHAEVNAISNMVAGGSKQILAVLIAAKRKRFTPCGGCMDWIMQFGGENCLVAYESNQGGRRVITPAKKLMPFYPI